MAGREIVEILSVKKEAKLIASELDEVEVGYSDVDLYDEVFCRQIHLPPTRTASHTRAVVREYFKDDEESLKFDPPRHAKTA